MTDGRVVLVTGGARGIGLACARAFEAQGDRVAITYRNKPVDDLFSLRCDQTDPDEVEAAFAAVDLANVLQRIKQQACIGEAARGIAHE